MFDPSSHPSSLDDLLSRWRQRQQAGEAVSLRELCADCPERLGELQERLRAVASMASFLGVNSEFATSTGTIPLPGPASGKTAARLEVPGYEILGELGQGGMGIVYLARQVSLKRLVALKTILAGRHASAEQRIRLRREAEAAARVKHPNVVQVYEVGEHEGLPFLALEYVEGDSLARRLGSAPLPPRQAAELVEKLAHAVHAAHQEGIVHRDLKPGNVLLASDGTPRITDFGLARQIRRRGADRP
jgi:serine/threonine-protein kinase